MKLNHLLPAVGLLAGLAGGCAVGPDYQKPAAPAPAQWSEPLAGGETNRPAALAAWWKNFHDAELDSLIRRAANSNLDLRIAQARVREARAAAGAAAADRWPTLDAGGAYQRQLQSQQQPLISEMALPEKYFENDVYQAGFDAAWEIDVFGGKRRATEAARAEAVAAELGQRAVLVTLLGEVARNYVAVRGGQSRLAITRENIRAQEQTLEIIQTRFTNGLATDLEIQQAGALLAATQAQLPTLASRLQASIHRLGVLLGQAPGTLRDELAAAAPVPPLPPEVPVGLPSELLLRRPDVQRAERQLAAATARIGLAQSDLFPKFFLTGQLGSESVSASDWFTGPSKYWAIGPTVQWRIFDAGRIRANVKIQNARQEQALAAYEQTVLTAFEEVENGLVSYAQEQVRRDSLETAAAASRKALERAEQLYANGLSNFINVLDAERSLYQIQDAQAQSTQAQAENLIALYKGLGGGWETAPAPVAHGGAAKP
jgi:NodT family efflux transporter outer membrane factor (OMF) lipoprotein